LILIFCDPNYKRSAHLIFDRVASVAAMQEWLRIFPKNCRDRGTLVPAFDAIKHGAGRSSVVEAGILIALAGR